jgi:type I restriction enzyme S subunit
MMKKAPNGWEIQSIDEIVFFQEGPGVRNTQFTQSGVKLLNVGNINDSKIDLSRTKIYISEDEAYGKYKHFLVDSGDLLIACSGIVVSNFHNKIAFVKDSDLPLCMNTSTMRFKTLDPKKLSLDFFRYFLMTDVFKHQLQKLITGSAQLNFGPSHIKQMSIILPPLPQQEKIVSVLDTASALVEKQKTLLKKYDLFLNSKFIEMFGDPVKNPMGWEEVKLETLGKWSSGGTPTRTKPEYFKGEISWYSAGELNSLHTKNSIEKITDEALQKSSAKLFKRGTLLIGMYDTAAFKMSILSFDATTNQAIANIEHNQNLVNVYYLYYAFQQTKEEYLLSRVGVRQQNLSLSKIKNFATILPPIDLQTRFAQIVEQTEALKQKEQQKLEKLQTLYDALMKRAFNGEIR